MFYQDLPSIFTWWSILFLLGAIFFPLISHIFKSFWDRGYIFAKVIGMLVLTYIMWIVSTLRLAVFSQTSLFIILLVLVFIDLAFLFFERSEKFKHSVISSRSPRENSNNKRSVIFFILFEEFLFSLCLIFWSWVKGHQPDLIGLEKYMDFGFINSLLRTKYFPPLDIWLSQSPTYNGGYFINYYYFGHLVTAVLTKLTGINPAVTFNLMLATIFAFCFTGAFSIGTNLFNNIHLEGVVKRHLPGVRMDSWKVVISGLLTGYLVTLAGNLHTIYAFFKPYIPADKPVPFWQLPFAPSLSTYWYPNATRFIPFTIHEFPSYSFVVSDLHGHVLDIPFVLLTIALLLSLMLEKTSPHPSPDRRGSSEGEVPLIKIIVLGFLLAVLYMTNAWDAIIYFGLSGLVFLYIFYIKYKADLISWLFSVFKYCVSLLLLFIIFSLPFQLHFKPFVFGIGVVKDHSPLWMLAILWGFFYFCVAGFITILIKQNKLRFVARLAHFLRSRWLRRLAETFDAGKKYAGELDKSEVFLLLLILLSTALLIFPELFYVKDIYPLHYRANTMFKLGYQAFIMLSLVSGFIIVKVFSNLSHNSNWSYKTYTLFLLPLLFLVVIYPYFSVNSYFGNLKTYKGLYGLSYLNTQYPDDYQGVLWIQNKIKDQPVILEAVGDSYTNYSRISANTGLPTVLGWPVHEWLWRGSYDEPGKRVEEVKNFYSTSDVERTKSFLKKYHVQYVVFGQLEHEKYPGLKEEKFAKLGNVVFESGETKIYQINNSL